MFKLTIEKGEPAGAVFDLLEGENVVGRSSSAKFRVNAPDVSGQHLRIVVRKGQAVAENLSRYGSLVDGTAIQGPTPLKPGQRIAIGKTTVLLFQTNAPPTESASDDAATGQGSDNVEATGAAPAAAAAEGRTGQGRTSAAPGGDVKTRASSPREAGAEALSQPGSWAAEEGATRAMMTRAAGEEELDFLRKADRQHARSRATIITIAVALLAGVALFFVTRRPPVEQVVSWPVNKDGEPLEEQVDSPLGGLTVSYPKVPDAQVSTMAGGFTITCSLGQRHDLRLQIILEETVDDLYATETLDTSIARWKQQVTSENAKWNIDPPMPVTLFLGNENGILFKSLPYQRHDERSWAGVANIFRNGRRFIVLRAEVPAEDRARAEEILYTPFATPAADFERSHWEGGPDVPSASEADILSRAHEELRRLAPATWDSVEQQLVGVLRKAVTEKRPDDEKDALDMLVQLRGKKTLWYNEQLVQKEAAVAQGDSDRVRRIAEYCKAVFSNPSDQRFYEVRKW